MNRHCNPEAPAFTTDKDHGLTKREYFAAAAMQGFLANGNTINVANRAVYHAEELIEALNKHKEDTNAI